MTRSLLLRVTSALLATALLATALLGCDATSTEPTSQIVVESYQIAGEALGAVRLNRTVPVGEAFSPSGTGITGARVAIERLDADGRVQDTFLYLSESDEPGRYLPEDPRAGVVPGATYRLVAETPAGERVTSTTVVPDTISLLRTANRDVVYQGPVQPALTISRSSTDPSRQDVYVFSTTSLLDFRGLTQEELEAELTPFYADAYDPEEDAIGELRVNSSGILNEGNFDRAPNGSITVDLPWLGIAFYGPNRISLSVLDVNYVDFLRSQQAQQNGRPGEIPNVLDRVDGGTGLFGSFARVEVDVVVRRP